jgi:hypothetical protein
MLAEKRFRNIAWRGLSVARKRAVSPCRITRKASLKGEFSPIAKPYGDHRN